ncbi:hypothetical protein EYF80_043033 [Liparis tanakae]|uniref:Uncharacterized protein n=1 Tax=Liparis tanakae TaxID=230148 RepID=A0A4Z2FZI7_9TELE|nr:hypothetical protein EYF80_043033 [Liparis tanakae]
MGRNVPLASDTGGKFPIGIRYRHSKPGRHSHDTPPLPGASLQMWAQPWSLFMQFIPSVEGTRTQERELRTPERKRYETHPGHILDTSSQTPVALFIHITTQKIKAPIRTLPPDQVQAYHSRVITTRLLQRLRPKAPKVWLAEDNSERNEETDRENVKKEKRNVEGKGRRRERWRQKRII